MESNIWGFKIVIKKELSVTVGIIFGANEDLYQSSSSFKTVVAASF